MIFDIIFGSELGFGFTCCSGAWPFLSTCFHTVDAIKTEFFPHFWSILAWRCPYPSGWTIYIDILVPLTALLARSFCAQTLLGKANRHQCPVCGPNFFDKPGEGWIFLNIKIIDTFAVQSLLSMNTPVLNIICWRWHSDQIGQIIKSMDLICSILPISDPPVLRVIFSWFVSDC